MRTLGEIVRAASAGEVSPGEVVREHLDRITREQPRINAFVRVLADEAMEQARQLEREGSRGRPLFGAPVTIKDSIDVAGLPTYCGSRFRLDHRATVDAVAVARLRSAGAIVIGKTNCPEFLANYESDNHITGRTNHPLDPEFTAGGSSGGEAAAIASGCSAGGLGSDGGGSIRWPAHCCGIAGLKPTPGSVPATGHYPLIRHPGGLLGVVGPMARTAADLKLLFQAVEGYHPSDPFAVPGARGETAVKRIGVMESFYDVPVQPSIRDAVRSAAAAATRLGVPVESYMPEGLERAPNVWSFFFTELATPFTRKFLEGREDDAHWTGVEFYQRMKNHPDPTGVQVVESLGVRDQMRASVLESMPGIVIAPAAGITAFRHRERRFQVEGGRSIGLFQAMMPLVWVNLLGLPAVTIPWGKDPGGMPVGVQLVGHPWCEEMLLDTAIRLEAARG